MTYSKHLRWMWDSNRIVGHKLQRQNSVVIGIVTIRIFRIGKNWRNFFKRHDSFMISIFRRSFISRGQGNGGEGGCSIVELSLICHLQNSRNGKFFVGISFSSEKSDEFFFRWRKLLPSMFLRNWYLKMCLVYPEI